MIEYFLFLLASMGICLHFIWSEKNTIKYYVEDPYAKKLAYYQGWNIAQQTKDSESKN